MNKRNFTPLLISHAPNKESGLQANSTRATASNSYNSRRSPQRSGLSTSCRSALKRVHLPLASSVLKRHLYSTAKKIQVILFTARAKIVPDLQK